MSKPKAEALGIETVATNGALNGRNHHIGRRTGLFLRLGTAPAGLAILAIRNPQGFAVGRSPRFTLGLHLCPFQGQNADGP